MGHRGRVQHLIDRLRERRPDAASLTIFFVEADADHPAGTRVIWGGRAREIAYELSRGEPAPPQGGPHKIILGAEFDV